MIRFGRILIFLVLAGCQSTSELDPPSPIVLLTEAKIDDHTGGHSWIVRSAPDVRRLKAQVTDPSAEWTRQTVDYRVAELEIEFRYSDGSGSHYILVNNTINDRIYVRNLSPEAYQELLFLIRRSREYGR